MNKVFGIGMSKTGTSSLGRCFEILGLTPTDGFRQELKDLVRSGRPSDPINNKFKYDPFNPVLNKEILREVFKIADRFKSFQDAPWYMLFKYLDEQYPNSKFILTLRKSSRIQAISDWWHNESVGHCEGPPTDKFIEKQSRIYEAHNAAVRSYFQDRPNDLLIVCWENGDGWPELCEFLDLPVPNESFPHVNIGEYGNQTY
jgi:hypothetical protein